MSHPVRKTYCPRCDGKGTIEEPDTLAIIPCPECKEGVMTKEEINRQVAEKVMGFQEGDSSLGKFWKRFNPDGSWIVQGWDFNPAERIDHAEMVLDKLQKDFQLNRVGGRFMFWIADADGGPEIIGPWADTAPMAICLAALESVKENKCYHYDERKIGTDIFCNVCGVYIRSIQD